MPPGSASIAVLLHLLFLSPRADAISFDYSAGFSSNTPNLTYQGDAFSAGGVLELTKNQLQTSLDGSAGRVIYSHPVHLWDAATRNLTNFTTHFSFVVQPVGGVGQQIGADGLTFFLALNGSSIPDYSGGGKLALFNDSSPSSPLGYIPTVAVEFDTFANYWDPTAVHVAIDVGSVQSVAYVNWTTFDRWVNASVNATVTYDAGTTNLSAVFSGSDGTERALSYQVDLREALPEWVSVGFSATTGRFFELHKILSWSFQSSLEIVGNNSNGNTTTTDGLGSGGAAPPTQLPVQRKKSKIGLLAGLLAGAGALAAATALTWFMVRQRNTGRWRRAGAQEGRRDLQEEINDGEFEGGRGPKSFAYPDLARATNNFAAEVKLGRGGFGDVYRGVLRDTPRSMVVAIKRVAKDSRQGKKEYVSEVKIISRLRHRNLVQLVGWCHDSGELLLVYEYMPNGSLDAHIYGRKGEAVVAPLSWLTRYGIAQGVAAALLYLHEGWEQCVVHRDVKPSNVMLDANFNAKLGDFGLARLVDHGGGMQTTVLAGTMGYLAPECATTGQASKESDVYSFGVVALEIACGRRPIEPAAGEGRVGLVDWVWDLYGRHAVVEAADPRLRSGEFDEMQMERLMVVGLWCAHPDFRRRPSMRQVVSALNFESPPPDLPAQMPVPTYGAPGGIGLASKPSSSTSMTAETSSSAASTSSGGSASAARPLLHSTLT
ncbi:hypothetical protein Taro_006229 [Colocasia esculenta]|uniref:non-specific serine/threonine protein kinase n=1 Tax=Colocasia esculenta TaxID=4460 RepID=A0A843TUM6_COLES|nr:hypothetical protein [Colocasia esculenta]